MTLGRCPLSILCSRGTPPRVYHRYKPSRLTSTNRAALERTWHMKDSPGQNLALAFRYKPFEGVPSSLGSGSESLKSRPPQQQVWRWGCWLWSSGFRLWGLGMRFWGLESGVSSTAGPSAFHHQAISLSSEIGTHQSVKARFWNWLSGNRH